MQGFSSRAAGAGNSPTVALSAAWNGTAPQPINTAAVIPTIEGVSTVGLQISGTFVATLQFEATVDRSSTATWVPIYAVPAAGGPVVTSITGAGATTGLWSITAAGMAMIRVRCSAYTSGTANVVLLGSAAPTDAPVGPSIPYQLISAASTNATVVKATAGVLTTVHASNANAAVRYLKVFDKATTPTVGTDVPKLTLPIPPNFSGIVMDSSAGFGFAAGIGLALTTGVLSSDSTAVSANEHVVNLGYR